MSQVYSNPEDESDDYALPDCEVFYMSANDFLLADKNTWMFDLMQDDSEYYYSRREHAESLAGWYWWACLPGCLPDSDAVGPFESEQEAINDIYNTYG